MSHQLDRLNELYAKYKDHFEGMFHDLLWQIMINNVFDSCKICFTVIVASGNEIGIVHKGERGYSPTQVWFKTANYTEAMKIVRDLNQDMFDLDPIEQHQIVAESMSYKDFINA